MADTSKEPDFYRTQLQEARKQLALFEKSGRKKSDLAILKKVVRLLEKLVRRYEKPHEVVAPQSERPLAVHREPHSLCFRGHSPGRSNTHFETTYSSVSLPHSDRDTIDVTNISPNRAQMVDWFISLRATGIFWGNPS